MVTQGVGVGEPLVLLPWQTSWIAELDANVRRVSALSVARGAGKTTLVAGLGAAAVAGPWRQPRGLALIVGSTYKQARLCFQHALSFLAPLIKEQPGRWRILDSEHQAVVSDKLSGSALEAREATPASLSGPAPALVIADEGASWRPTQSESMYSVLRTSLGKLPNSRMLCIGTRPTDTTHWFEKLLQRTGTVYAAPADCAIDDESAWHAANPSLRYFPPLLEVYREECADALADPSLVRGFRCLRLNQGGSDHAVSVLVEAEDWRRGEVDELPARVGPSVLAFDLSGGDAMCAAVSYDVSTGALSALAAFPALPDLAERGRRDGADYQRMYDEGDLLVLGPPDGRVVPVERLVQEAVKRWGRPARVICDYHQLRELQTVLGRAGIPDAALVTTGMGLKDSPPRIRNFRRAVNSGRVRVLPRLLIRTAMANCRTVADSMGEERVIKGGLSGRKRTARDDVAIAALMCVSEGAVLPVPRKRRTFVVPANA